MSALTIIAPEAAAAVCIEEDFPAKGKAYRGLSAGIARGEVDYPRAPLRAELALWAFPPETSGTKHRLTHDGLANPPLSLIGIAKVVFRASNFAMVGLGRLVCVFAHFGRSDRPTHTNRVLDASVPSDQRARGRKGNASGRTSRGVTDPRGPNQTQSR